MSAARRAWLSTLSVCAAACASVDPNASFPTSRYARSSTAVSAISHGHSQLLAHARIPVVRAESAQAQVLDPSPPIGGLAAILTAEHAASELPRMQERVPRVEDGESSATPEVPQASLEQGMDELSPGSVTSFKNGLRFSFPSTSSKVHIGALVQQDWVFFAEDSELRDVPGIGDLQEAIFFRRARIKFDGTTHDFIEWDFDADLLSNEDVVFDDLWVGFKATPGIGNIRIGHVKLPQGLESVTSNRVFTFLERSSQHDAFYREYGPGILFFDNWGDNRGQWSFSLHRLDPNGDGVSVGDGDYAATGRLTHIPYSAESDERLLHIGVSASYRSAAQGVVRFRARPEFRIARETPVFVDTGPIDADESLVLGSEAALINGPVSIQAEYTAASALGRKAGTPGGADDDPWFHGGFVQFSYFLTGEHRPYDRRLARMGNLSPTKSVSTDNRLAGAWELAARYTVVDLNDSDVLGGELDAWTAGVNWYWSPFFRVQFNYVMTDRDAPDGSGTAHGFLMRFSLNL